MAAPAANLIRSQPPPLLESSTFEDDDEDADPDEEDPGRLTEWANVHGPAVFFFSAPLTQRIQQKKETGVCLPDAALDTERRIFLSNRFLELLYEPSWQDYQPSEQQGQKLDSAQGAEADTSEPLWFTIDCMVKKRKALAREKDSEIYGKKTSAGENDELWHEFWEHYRGDASKRIDPAVASMRASSGPRPPTGNTLPSMSRPTTNAGNTLPLTSRPSTKDPRAYPSSPLNSARDPRLSPNSKGPNTSIFPTLVAPTSARPPKLGQHFDINPPSTSGGFPAVAKRIMQEYDRFEKHERHLAGEPEVPHHHAFGWLKTRKSVTHQDLSDAESSSEESDAEWWGLDEEDLEEVPVAQKLRRRCTTHTNQIQENLESIQKIAQADSTEEQLPTAARLSLHRNAMTAAQAARTALPALERNCRAPVHCFTGFDDYKKRQHFIQDAKPTYELKMQFKPDVKSKTSAPWRVSLSKEDVAVMASGAPQSFMSASVHAHESLREWRRGVEQGVGDAGADPATPPASRRLKVKPLPPPAFFSRPWSRDKRANKDPDSGAKQNNGAKQSSAGKQSETHMSPIERFAKVCRNTGLQPQLASIRFLMKLPPKLDIRGMGYADEDLLALAAALPYDGIIEAVDFGENPRLTDTSLCTILRALSRRFADMLQTLKIDHCNHLGKHTITLGVKLIRKGTLMNLQMIDFGGLTIGLQEYLDLAQAVQGHQKIRDVRLAETGLGMRDRAHAVEVLEKILGNKQLESLELGWNSLDTMAFKTLGRCLLASQKLKSLGIANTGPCWDPAINGSPVLVFLEFLSADSTLTALDLSNNSFDEQAPLVLEASACRHPRLETIDISVNPIGLTGKRSLLRLIARCPVLNAVRHEQCSVLKSSDCRGPFDGDPSGIYVMNMAHPVQRAILRLLLMRLCEGPHATQPSKIVQRAMLRFGNKETPFSFESLKRNKHGVWDVPVSGELMCEVAAGEVILGEQAGSKDPPRIVVDRMLRRSRITLDGRLKTSIVLAQIKAESDEFELKTLLVALSRDFMLTPAQVEALCKTGMDCHSCGKDPVGTYSLLLPCLMTPREVQQVSHCLPTLNDAVRVNHEARWLLNLNYENPTGHYDLNLAVPSDRSTVEQLLFLNRWELHVWKAAGRTDISQHGNWKNFRNEVYGNRAYIWRTEEWGVTGNDTLSFDYVSLRRPPKHAQAVSDEAWTQILDALAVAIYKKGFGNVKRSIARYSQVVFKQDPRNSVSSTRTSPRRAHGRRMSTQVINNHSRLTKRWETDEEHTRKRDSTYRCALWAVCAVSGRVWVRCSQLRDLLCVFCWSTARSDVLTALLLRTMDWPLNNKICRCKFSHENWTQLKQRLGYLTLFQVFQPENCWFHLDLAVYEQRKTLQMLISITVAEDLRNMSDARINRLGPGSDENWDELVQGVPQTWEQFENIPPKGIFEAVYRCSMDTVKLRARRRVAVQAGWENIPDDEAKMMTAVTWWSVLDEVPMELIHLLEFFFQKFDCLDEVFKFLDVNSDGVLNAREFMESIRSLGYTLPPDSTKAGINGKARALTVVSQPSNSKKTIADNGRTSDLSSKIQSAEEERLIDAIMVVNRFLDPNHDGAITHKEFKVLEGIWRELTQTSWEFVRHMRTCFMSLRNAWEFADEDGSGSMDWAEFKRLARRWEFDGPIRHVYMHMDVDGNDEIGINEWMRLETTAQPHW